MAVGIRIKEGGVDKEFSVTKVRTNKQGSGTQDFEIPKTLGAKTAVANGTYTASGDGYDGYSSFTVNVPATTPNLGTKSITANGSYSASGDGYDGYSSVTVNVAGQSARLTSKSITSNGTYSASGDGYDGYSSVTVNVAGESSRTGGLTATSNGVYQPSSYGYDAFSLVTVHTPELRRGTIAPTSSIGNDGDYYVQMSQPSGDSTTTPDSVAALGYSFVAYVGVDSPGPYFNLGYPGDSRYLGSVTADGHTRAGAVSVKFNTTVGDWTDSCIYGFSSSDCRLVARAFTVMADDVPEPYRGFESYPPEWSLTSRSSADPGFWINGPIYTRLAEVTGNPRLEEIYLFKCNGGSYAPTNNADFRGGTVLYYPPDPNATWDDGYVPTGLLSPSGHAYKPARRLSDGALGIFKYPITSEGEEYTAGTAYEFLTNQGTGTATGPGEGAPIALWYKANGTWTKKL